MKNEIYNTKLEFHNTNEHSQPANDCLIPQGEFSIPKDEFSIPRAEFIDTSDQTDASERTPDTTAYTKKKREKQRRSKMFRKMSYMVASTVAVVSLSQTLNVFGNIRENVQFLGGSVKGDLRFSIQWNDTDKNPNDFDAHCREPNGYNIYYGNRGSDSPSGGTLDVDITYPTTEPGVENIVYPKKSDMEEGTYMLYVYCFSNNGGKSGFKAEVAFGSQTYSFNYKKNMNTGEMIPVAEVTLQNGRFTIKKLMP